MAARAQAWQFAAALVLFHGSEYILAAAFHGHRNVTATCEAHKCVLATDPFVLGRLRLLKRNWQIAFFVMFPICIIVAVLALAISHLALNRTGALRSICSSLLISKQYVLAMSFAMAEHLTESLFFPEIKGYLFVSNIGLLMVLVGEIIRKIAVVTAGRAFTHVIRIQYEDQHQLVTHGIYRFMRHPGYSGFLLWAVGTQVMLCNPVSTVAFALVLWRFFSRRIPYEEFFLRQFFGSQYEEYARKVHSGLPFIN